MNVNLLNNYIIKISSIILLIVIFLGIFGCERNNANSAPTGNTTSQSQPAEYVKTWYGAAIINKTPGEIENANVVTAPDANGATLDQFFGGPGVGVLVPGTYEKGLVMDYFLPPTETVTWTTAGGKNYKQVVKLPHPIPPGFDGVVFFRILPGEKADVVILTSKEYYDEHQMP